MTAVVVVGVCGAVAWWLMRYLRRPPVLPRSFRLVPVPAACEIGQLCGQPNLCGCGNFCGGMALSPLGRMLYYETFAAEMDGNRAAE